MPNVQGARLRRAQSRLGRVRLDDPGALPHVNERNGINRAEARRIKRASSQLSASQKAAALRRAQKAKAKDQYNPLAPLTGANMKQELGAATRLEFSDRERAQRQAAANAAQTTANTGTYYDDYKAALAEATSRIQANDQAAVDAQQSNVDRAYQQDSAGVAARDAAASEQAAKLGRGPVQSNEGAQGVAAQRTSGNDQVGQMREHATHDFAYNTRREAGSVQAKAEAYQRASAKQASIAGEGRQLAKEKGDFKVNFRNKTRESERQWSAVTKEFGLKKQTAANQAKNDAAQRKIDSQKTEAQRIVARIYASADKAKARAQVRVAKIQLEKGKIDQHSYSTIKNIYEGLPANGVSGGAAAGGTKGKPGVGSGSGGSLLPWEKDKVDLAYRSLISAGATANERRAMIDSLVKRGQIPARLARVAWARYEKKVLSSHGPQGLSGPNT